MGGDGKEAGCRRHSADASIGGRGRHLPSPASPNAPDPGIVSLSMYSARACARRVLFHLWILLYTPASRALSRVLWGLHRAFQGNIWSSTQKSPVPLGGVKGNECLHWWQESCVSEPATGGVPFLCFAVGGPLLFFGANGKPGFHSQGSKRSNGSVLRADRHGGLVMELQVELWQIRVNLSHLRGLSVTQCCSRQPVGRWFVSSCLVVKVALSSNYQIYTKSSSEGKNFRKELLGIWSAVHLKKVYSFSITTHITYSPLKQMIYIKPKENFYQMFCTEMLTAVKIPTRTGLGKGKKYSIQITTI